MSPPRMAPVSVSATPTAVFFLLLLSIFSAAIARSDLPQIALPESDPQSTSTEISFSNSNQNPLPEQDSEIVRWLEFTKVEEDDSKTADLVSPEFPVLNRHRPLRLRHRRGCGHGRRFNHQDRNRQMGYGNDMISSDERRDRPDDFKISSVEFDPRQHGSRSVSLDKTEFKGPFLHHHHHHHDDEDDDLEHQVKNLGKFSWDKHTRREFDHGHDHHHKRPPFDRDGEEDWQPHHRHHHPQGQDHGGLMILERFRKFLDHF